jgi:RND family efflux transporter MFP subunit
VLAPAKTLEKTPDKPALKVGKPARTRRLRLGLIRWGLLAAVIALIAWGGKRWFFTASVEAVEITTAIKRANLPIVVTERGELESSKTIDVRCEVEGHQNKIVSILPEGTRLKKGDVVVVFDSEQIKRSYEEQEAKCKTAEGKMNSAKAETEVQTQKADKDNDAAETALAIARLERVKYIDGEYKALLDESKGDIELAKKDLEDAREKLEHYRTYVKRGFGTPEQLRVKELEFKQKEFVKSSKERKLEVLEKYTKERQETELKAKERDAEREVKRSRKSGEAAIEKARSEYEAAKQTAQVEKSALERLGKQLKNCSVPAPEDGILVYMKDRWWDDNSRIQAGAMVHFRQGLFSLPDLTKMQMKVKIHEAVVKKVKQGMPVEIRIDAYSSKVLHGTVKSVATLAASENWWSRFVKEYETIITIDDLPLDAGLKPGFTGEVKILVNELPNVLVAPVQAVGQKGSQYYCYVSGPGNAVERRDITVGENNDQYVEIKGGVEEGEQVVLDARARLAAESKANKDKGQPDEPAPSPGEKPAESKVTASVSP